MLLDTVLFLVLYLVFTILVPDEINPDSDKGLTTSQLAAKHGYAFEEHTVTTEDGYILQLFRISSSLRNSTKRPPVLCMHGLLLSSDIWFLGGPRRGLGYLLANQGYDVWVGNARGNKYSRKHVELDPDKDSKFWEFSFNEMGYYDLPAEIDYITKITGYEKIFYVGFSQGTTSYYVMGATRPEMNKKIILGTLLAPVAYVYDVSSVFFTEIAAHQTESENSAKLLGIRELLRSTKLSADVFDLMCRNESPFQQLCKMLVFSLGGENEDELDTRILPIAISGFAGASTQSFFHYTQLITSVNFQKFDYGSSENVQRYGQDTPPVYNIKNIIAPTALFYGNNDILTSPAEVERMSKELPNMVHKYKVKDPKFTHLDFILAKNVVVKLHRHVLECMSKY